MCATTASSDRSRCARPGTRRGARPHLSRHRLRDTASTREGRPSIAPADPPTRRSPRYRAGRRHTREPGIGGRGSGRGRRRCPDRRLDTRSPTADRLMGQVSEADDCHIQIMYRVRAPMLLPSGGRWDLGQSGSDGASVISGNGQGWCRPSGGFGWSDGYGAAGGEAGVAERVAGFAEASGQGVASERLAGPVQFVFGGLGCREQVSDAGWQGGGRSRCRIQVPAGPLPGCSVVRGGSGGRAGRGPGRVVWRARRRRGWWGSSPRWSWLARDRDGAAGWLIMPVRS